MIIATRTLTLDSPTGAEPVVIAVHAPEPSDALWLCRYAIGWPGSPRESFAGGVDAIQALQYALQRIGLELYLSPDHEAGRLRWEKPGDGYGFPVPKEGRDLLVGSDRLFEG